jgi:hypothetical protein
MIHQSLHVRRLSDNKDPTGPVTGVDIASHGRSLVSCSRDLTVIVDDLYASEEQDDEEDSATGANQPSGAALEMPCGVTATAGSNPALSA